MDSTEYWEDHPRWRISSEDPSSLRHSGVAHALEELKRKGNRAAMRLETCGKSVEGRSISLATLGRGPIRVLMWSQMHGDEPTHTAVLLDLMNWLLSANDDRDKNQLLERCTLHMIPMLNPDGAERWTRRNAQDIDINRDAVHLASPEGRILQQAVERLRPDFAFNLHNQSPRWPVEGTMEPAAVSLMAPPRNAAAEDTESTLRAKQVALAFAAAVRPICGDAVTRYPADYMHRAFGESVQRQGVSTTLIEAGAWRDRSPAELVRLHYAGLAATLGAIATGSFAQHDPQEYQRIPFSGEHRLFDTMLKGVTMLSGAGAAPFKADIGVNIDPPESHGARAESRRGEIADLGDLSVTSASHVIEAPCLCLAGGWFYDPSKSPTTLPTADDCLRLLRLGVTNLLCRVDVDDESELAALEALGPSTGRPINLAFLAHSRQPSIGDPTYAGRLIRARAAGVLGHVDPVGPTFLNPVDAAHLPHNLASLGDARVDKFAENNRRVAKILKAGQGAVRTGAAANLVLFDAGESSFGPESRLSQGRVRWGLLNGSAFEVERPLESIPAGIVIRG